MCDASLFAGISGRGQAAAEVTSGGWLRAILDVEVALARAQEEAGLVSAGAVAEIAEACRPEHHDPAAIGRAAEDAANPVGPLVRRLRQRLPGPAAAAIHAGATSQDVLDTAAMLIVSRAAAPILDDLSGVAGACGRLARTHRDTLMAGRTLTQQAAPITFGLKAAGWLTAIDSARGRLAEVCATRLAVQLGGAAGTLAALGEHGLEVFRNLAAGLGLAEPVLPWHTDRTRIADVAGALGTAAGAIAKIATDVTLLCQTEVAEVAESAAHDGRGTSSAMPHKRNPVAAVSAIACAHRAPGLVGTILSAMAQEHERAAGGWQAEWETLSELLRLTGSAASWCRESLGGLTVDAARMRANLGLTGGLAMAERVVTALGGTPSARQAVTAACTRASASARGCGDRPVDDVLIAELLAEPAVTLPAARLRELLDPAGYIGSAAALVDRALAAHGSGE